MGIIAQWCGNGLIAYLVLVLRGIGITDAYSQTLINGGLQLWCYATVIAGAYCVNHLRRRQAMLIGFAGMLVSFILWTVLSAVNQERGYEKGLGIGVVFSIFFYYIWYNMSVAPIFPVYTVRIDPSAPLTVTKLTT